MRRKTPDQAADTRAVPERRLLALRAPRLSRATLVLALLFLSPYAPASAQTAASVTVAEPIVKRVTDSGSFIGRFAAVDDVDVRARVSGYLQSIHFSDGALVAAGDLLFTIDQRPYKAALAQAQADVNAATARKSFADTDLERAANLRPTDNIPQQVYDQRKQTRDLAVAELERSKGALEQAQLNLSFTEIRAPIAGRASRRTVSPGTLITADQTTLVNLVSLDPSRFYFDVDERSYLAFLRDRGDGNKNVTVTLTDGSGGARVGEIDFVDNRIDQATGTMRARAVLDNKDLSLVPGLFGRVVVNSEEGYEAALIPDDAVVADQDRRLVYVVGEDNHVQQRPISLGPRSEGYRVVRKGLERGDRVVLTGLTRLRPGAEVQPRLEHLQPILGSN